jgi:hypothetical protein
MQDLTLWVKNCKKDFPWSKESADNTKNTIEKIFIKLYNRKPV